MMGEYGALPCFTMGSLWQEIMQSNKVGDVYEIGIEVV